MKTLEVCLLHFLLISPSLVSGQDIYDRIDAFAESLKTWQCTPPVIEEYQEDSLDLMTWFPGAAIHFDSAGIANIRLPSYMDILSTELVYEGKGSKDKGKDNAFDLEIESDDTSLYLDRRRVLQLDTTNISKSILRTLKADLINLRTMGLPARYISKPEIVCDSVSVKLAGKNYRRYTFSHSAWEQVNSVVCYGMQVYAGILDFKILNDKLRVSYYQLVTLPEASGHHYIEHQKVYSVANVNENRSVSAVKSTAVTIIAYIRMDNLSEMFAQDMDSIDSAATQYKIKIRD